MAEKGSELKKEIGVFDGISILSGIMIGSGIFYLGSYVLIHTNMNIGLALLSWIIGGGISLLCGLCYAELGASDPRAGGMTVYLSHAYSPIVGFLYGFNLFVLAGPGAIAAISLAFASILKNLVPIGEFGIKGIAAITIVLLSAVNYRGVRLGMMVQNLSMIGKLIPIILIVLAGLIKGEIAPDLSIPFGTVGFDIGNVIGMISVAVVATLWAYDGWANLNSLAEEVKNPSRTLPIAIVVSIVAITVLYTLFNYSIFRVLSLADISGMIAADDFYLGTAAATKILGMPGEILAIVTWLLPYWAH